MGQQEINERQSEIPHHNAFEVAEMLKAAHLEAEAEALGFTQAWLADSNSSLEMPRWYDLFEMGVERTEDAYFGIHFAFSRAERGAVERSRGLALLALSASSIGEAFGHLVRYQHMFTEAERHWMEERGPETRIVHQSWGPSRPAHVQSAEKIVAQACLALKMAEPAIVPLRLEFKHERADGGAYLEKLLGAPVVMGAEQNCVVVRRDEMERKVRGARPDFFVFFQKYLQEKFGPGKEPVPASVEESSSQLTFEGAVRAEICRLLHSGVNLADAVAAGCEMSARTLQRRLQERGTSLSELVESVRKERACALLLQGMSLKEVAFLTGYASSQAFLKAFRKWFEQTPLAWRDAQLEALGAQQSA